MSKYANPFTPTFGIVPPYLAGRESILESMGEAFDAGIGNPNLCTLLIGPRGSGKTALLACIGNEARERGWLVVDCIAESGMLEDVLQHATAAASQIVAPTEKRKLVGISIGNVAGVEWETDEPPALNWRMNMEALLAALRDADVGLLITVDEVRADVDELVRLASSYQLFIRAGFNVSLVMAGLPANITDLIDDKQVSFLRRARQRQLGLIGDADVARTFRKTVENAGKSIDDDALSVAVAATGGFPYMMQLVGYYAWAESGDDEAITQTHAARGAAAAASDFLAGVLERTWREMSKGDRAFASAMVPDANGSTLADIAKRMGKGTNYASTYKKRLLRLGVIGERAGSTFDFDLPLMREFVQERSAADAR